jgi:hypothetical protein
VDDFFAGREGRKVLITEFVVVQYDDDDDDDDNDDDNNVNNIYWCNITGNVPKNYITFLHSCKGLVVKKVLNLQGI